MRIFSGLVLFVLSFQLCAAKSVDEKTAKVIASNFCKTEGVAIDNSGLSMVWAATAQLASATVTDFYVFNTGANGFVIISGDDNVEPVLAFSTESSLRADYLPDNIKSWLENYKNQINYVIANNISGNQVVRQKWNDLQVTSSNTLAKTTTASVVYPLMKTMWNQEPYYNFMCPYDYAASANAVTGCVATAMAQVMKYWNWPKKGVGSNSYSDGSFGVLSADFGHTTYHWDSMPMLVGYNNVAVGTLMYHAGVSVNMSYGVAGSGAFVVSAMSPILNCAQYALPTYFSYKSSLQGLLRNSYSDSDWVHMLKDELNAKRPVIYSGYGPGGGHCFVTDGYITYNRFHFNWGWGAYGDGYYIVENLAPGNETFNDQQTVIVGIMPDSSVVAGVNEISANNNILIYPNPASDVVNIDLSGVRATKIRLLDAEGREVMTQTPSVNAKVETINCSGFSDGIYFVELLTEGGLISSKLVIAR